MVENSSALAYLSIVCGEDQGGVIAGADGGGEELLFVSEPDTGPLQHKSHKKRISIWTQGSLWSHLFEHSRWDHVLRTKRLLRPDARLEIEANFSPEMV